MSDNQLILVINCGSSSLKFALLRPQSQEVVLEGIAERLGSENAILSWRETPIEAASKQQQPINNAGHNEAGQAIVQLLSRLQLRDAVIAVGHRVVHGGERFQQSTLIDEAVITAIEACSPLAPLHNPANLIGIGVTREHLPQLPQIAVFDTAFHQTMPRQAYTYALPYKLYREFGVRRYGFHGTSFRYVSQQAIEQFRLNADNHGMVIAHLGNGASACAVENSASVDTTMGLTPLEGLVMGTRSGNIDPGLFRYLHDRCDYSFDEIDNLLNKHSGLQGISELSNDMRTLEQAASEGHAQAQLAIDVFCYQLAKQLAGLMTALNRCDALIFTGGIGENSINVRAKTIAQLAVLGWRLDETRNLNHGADHRGIISLDQEPLIGVVATNEELMIAQDVIALLQPNH